MQQKTDFVKGCRGHSLWIMDENLSAMTEAEITFTDKEMYESFIHVTFSHAKSYHSNEIAR